VDPTLKPSPSRVLLEKKKNLTVCSIVAHKNGVFQQYE